MNSATAASTDGPTSARTTHVPQSGTVWANGQELFYEIHGDGPPLVLVMGIGYDSSLWTLQQVPELSTRFQVILLDTPAMPVAAPESITRTPSRTWLTTSAVCSTPSKFNAPTWLACRWEA